MKINDGFMLRNVAGKNIVVAVGEAAMDFDGMISLNETGAFLWKILEDGADYDTLLNKLLDEYDIDEETAKKDIDAFIKRALDEGFLSE